jgi:hypothetical protein
VAVSVTANQSGISYLPGTGHFYYFGLVNGRQAALA